MPLNNVFLLLFCKNSFSVGRVLYHGGFTAQRGSSSSTQATPALCNGTSLDFCSRLQQISAKDLHISILVYSDRQSLEEEGGGGG